MIDKVHCPPQVPEGQTKPDGQYSNASHPLLEVAGVSAWYGRRHILSEIGLTLKAGDFICLSGPNGCGKSTLMALLAGLGRHGLTFTGTITLEGQDLHRMKPKERAKRLAYMSQTESSLWNFTVREVILTGRYCHTGLTGMYSKEDYEQAEVVAAQLQLTSLLHRKVHQLSGGEFQRVRIARSLCQQPNILLLDEPAANLDLGLRHDLLHATKELARQQGTAVLLSIHDINLAAAFAKELALLRPLATPSAGLVAPGISPQLILGSPAEVMTEENLRLVYNRSFQVFTHPVHGGAAVWVE